MNSKIEHKCYIVQQDKVSQIILQIIGICQKISIFKGQIHQNKVKISLILKILRKCQIKICLTQTNEIKC